MKNNKNAPRWIALIEAVISTFNDGTFTTDSDKTTAQIIESCRKRLASGSSLTTKQSAALTEAIRLRADSDFVWDGEIKLDRNQISYARKSAPWFFAGTTAKAPELDQYVTRAEMQSAIDDAVAKTKAEMRDLFQHYFSTISATFQHDFSSVSALFQHGFSTEVEKRPLEANDSSLLPLTFSTEHNITKPNQTNGSDALPIIASETPSEKPIKKAITHKGSLTHPDDKKKSRVNGNGARADERTISLFQQNAESAPSGNLELDSEKFHLVFGSYEKQFERISKVSSPEWVKAFDAEQGRVSRDMERQAGARWTLSPVFSEGDTHGYQAPLANSAVILCWNGPLIEGCWLVVFEDELVFQPINFRKSKTLIWKGQPQQQTKLAA